MNQSGEEVPDAGAVVNVDVEPAEIPAVNLPPNLTLPVDSCIALKFYGDSGELLSCAINFFVSGTYLDGTNVTLNDSSKITFASQDPSIARVWEKRSSQARLAALVGVSAGKTKLLVFGKYTIDVTVVGQRRSP